MRLDYLFYLLAVVFFLITATSLALVADVMEKTLWVTGTIILGLVSLGLGYYRRPKPEIAAATSEMRSPDLGDSHIRESHLAESVEKHSEPSAAPITTTSVPMQEVVPIPVPTPEPPPTTTPAPAEAPQLPAEPQAPVNNELLTVKGINENRAAQLKAIGINSIEDLAKASPEDLAKNLTISPRITRMWIGTAKKLRKQPE